MLNVRALNKLLTDNTNAKLFPRWFLMTPNGSLIAYTSPADMREMRDQVALVSMTWKEQLSLREAQSDHESDSRANEDSPNVRSKQPLIQTMVLEFDKRNILVRRLQPKLLLVLEGGVPPGRKKQFQVTIEGPDGSSHSTGHGTTSRSEANGNSHHIQAPGSPSADSTASTTASTHKRRINVLDVHRRRLDAMARVLTEQFKNDKFEMPADLENRFF